LLKKRFITGITILQPLYLLYIYAILIPNWGNFTLNKLKLVESKGKSYYVLEVESHELEKLRLKYGLPKLLNGFKFHITVAIKEL
jgi:hypothetical protein